MIPGDDATETCNSGCCTGYDGFEIGLTSGKGNLQSAIAAANSATTVQDWSFVGAPPSSSGSPPPSGGGSYPADTCTWG
jgi:mannan endo-1,4-beta-mannosidase